MDVEFPICIGPPTIVDVLNIHPPCSQALNEDIGGHIAFSRVGQLHKSLMKIRINSCTMRINWYIIVTIIYIDTD